MVKLVVDAYNRNADAGEVKPTCPCLGEVLRGLKAQGKKLAVVTTDNHPIIEGAEATLSVTPQGTILSF
jgi:beta-phosphoglucomutase-like phosphatase (HAD superfamily)